MALANCRDCNADVSDRAFFCPKCGCYGPVKPPAYLWVLLVGLTVGFYVMFSRG